MPKFLDVTNTLAARSALNMPSISVLDFIDDPSDTDSHQAGFEAAIAAALDGSGEVVIPQGRWYVEGLVIPKKSPLKIRGAVGTMYPQASGPESEYEGQTTGTRLIRTGNLPVFILIGGVPPTIVGDVITDNNVDNVDWLDAVRDFVLEDVTIENRNAAATAPLVDFRAVTGCLFKRVCLFSPTYTAPLMHATYLMDSWFQFCQWAGGSKGIQIFDGSDTYFGTNAVWWVGCQLNDYSVLGIEIGDETSSHGQRPRVLQFIHHKQSSGLAGVQTHMHIRRATDIHFTQSYFEHYDSPTVIDIDKAFGIYGEIGFLQILNTGYTPPDAGLNISADAYNISMDVNSIVDNTMNIVTQANVSDPTIDIRISPNGVTYNGSTRSVGYDFTQLAYQKSEGSLCAYLFVREGFNLWKVGQPSTPAGDVQQFEISALDSLGNESKILRLRSYSHTSGSDPTTATYRDLALRGFLSLSGADDLGWVNFQNISPPANPAGGIRLYAQSDALTIDGSPILTAANQELDLADGENTFARRLINIAGLAPGNGNLRLTYFTAQRTETVTDVRTLCTVASVGATLARIGVYSVASNGDLTLVASTANDTTLWESTGSVTKALSASLSKVRGTRYAVGLLTVGTSTSPQLSGIEQVANTETAVEPRLSALVSSLADLPSTIASGSLVATFHQYYAALV